MLMLFIHRETIVIDIKLVLFSDIWTNYWPLVPFKLLEKHNKFELRVFIVRITAN